MDNNIINLLEELKNNFEGDIYSDNLNRILYSTDASAYKEKPIAVTRPKNKSDILKLIDFSIKNNVPIIPRAAGTSLAGQVVGEGIIVDVSKYLTKIIELNVEEKWVKVEPGVVLDELNKFLFSKGLFFGPETSTSNRCTIGGMIGNNSCGSHSLIYGSTRDHLLEVNTILSDGSEVCFKNLTTEEFNNKLSGNNLENKIYQNINTILSDKNNIDEINKNYPDSRIKRRNTGYAIDVLLNNSFFSENENKINLCKLLSGSEGTLAFVTDAKLNLVELPKKEVGLVCVHLKTLEESFIANIIALKHNPTSIELMDSKILELTKDNIEQNKNRFFLDGDPGALILVEFVSDSKDEIQTKSEKLICDLKQNNLGYSYPLVSGSDTKKVWNLRKAGLGVLSTMPGDLKPVPVIEDTAVCPEDLPSYIKDLQLMFNNLSVNCIYYAHIATGEIHIRPILNLKEETGKELFRKIAFETAKIVKKYKGSLSGEHGDGRLRGEFISLMIGDYCYNILKQIKETWDPNYIFNPHKIIGTPPMNTSLRYVKDNIEANYKTIFDFSKDFGILRSAEKCNGSADCRKSALIGGTMCPSYMASKNENQTTRARANVLREILKNNNSNNPFNSKELFSIMDLCLSCKACKAECPSGIDMTKMKAEFLQQYYFSNRIPIRTWLIANNHKLNSVFHKLPFYNLLPQLFKNLLGFSSKREFPKVYRNTLIKYYNNLHNNSNTNKTVYLFADEFINFNEPEIGIKAIMLLSKLGYKVVIPNHVESGRSYFSKGLLLKAKNVAEKNIKLLKNVISEQSPLIGIEPSAILSFRDEYPEIVDKNLVEQAKAISINTFLIDEFICNEFLKGNIRQNKFSENKLEIKLHGHCHQKTLSSTKPTVTMLSIPKNYIVSEIPSGCCGMAGSFGYEKEHYELSMKIGELVLFPEIRNSDTETIIAATGTSCRCQIKDGTGRKAFHPVEILFDALL